MSTPDDIADGIDATRSRVDTVNEATQNEIKRTVQAMRSSAEALIAQAAALDGSAYAQDKQTNIITADLAASAAQVRDLNPTEPPAPTDRTWFGYTRSGIGTELNQSPGIVRDFTGGKNVEVSKIRRTLEAGIPLWYSWKPDLLSSSWHNGVEDALRSAVTPESPPLYITLWHEPEGSSDAGGGTPAQKIPRWQDAHRRLREITDRLADLDIRIAPVLCDWTFWWTSKGSAEEWYSPQFCADAVDLIGFDVYPQGQRFNGQGRIARIETVAKNQPAPYADPDRNDTYRAVRLIAGLAKDRGLPWGSGETGIIDGSYTTADVEHGYSRENRADRFEEIAWDITQTLPAENLPAPRLWAWYNDGGCRLTGTGDSAGLDVWDQTIAGNPDGWPT